MEHFDYIVIGGGLAGLYTSYKLAQQGRVALVARASLEESNSFYAQGGMAAVTEKSDTPHDHFEDTIIAGRGLCIPEAVKVLTEEAPQRIEELIAMGMHFDREGGELALGLEGGHHHKRILHAGGDATGRLVTTFMIEQVRSTPTITICDQHLALRLLSHQGVCYGVLLYNEAQGVMEQLTARATILATGGAGALYHPTTNPPTALGDGLALALYAGAELRDLEFVQFHPTALYAPGQGSFLISEAVRGEGAHLYNSAGERFMVGRHPLAELAPRDTVAGEIFREMQRSKSSHVTLSLRHLDPKHITRRFPTITQHCAEMGLDFTDQIPVAPAAHYTVGGVATDLYGATNIAGLFAVGEVASTGVMGANRLASNSLIECLVFGKRIAERAPQSSSHGTLPSFPLVQSNIAPDAQIEWRNSNGRALMQQLGMLLMREVGILRTQESLERALEGVAALQYEAQSASNAGYIHALLVSGRLLVAERLISSALRRQESRGGHLRSDYPDTLAPSQAYHHIITQDSITTQYNIL